jgi:hypothetical protein
VRVSLREEHLSCGATEPDHIRRQVAGLNGKANGTGLVN